jgi:5'-3' exonuclease
MLLLVDYSSMLYRAYHSTPATIALNGVHGLLNSLARIVAERKPDGLAIALDEDWRPEFRVNVLPMYKTQRVSDEPDPVLPQEALGRRLLSALGLAVVGWPGYEAEDVIATLACRTDDSVEILSGDRDLFDLVEDPRIQVLYPGKGGLQSVNEAWIEEKYAIPGRRYGDFALLRGDPSDGLPGVPGIGEKTAANLISRYGSLDGLLAAAPELPLKLRSKLREAGDYLEAARSVVLPVRNLPLPDVPLALPRRPHDVETIQFFETEYKLGNAIARLRDVLGM